jgi:hypothetical protein
MVLIENKGYYDKDYCILKIKKNIFEPHFEKLALEEGIEVEKKYESASSKLITFLDMADYNDDLRVKSLSLKIPYKNNIICVHYEVGDIKLGRIESAFSEINKLPQFDITTRSHFKRLIFRNKNILKVNSKKEKFKKRLEKLLSETELELIARKTLFLPETKSINYNIKTEFSLSFDDNLEVLMPLISFYKSLIDWSKE